MKRDLQERARELRTQGYSVPQIQKILNVSRSSVSLWVRGIELSQEQRANLKSRGRFLGDTNLGAKTNQVRYRDLRLRYQQEGREKAKEKRPLHMMGCIMYWCEGSKERNKIDFVNSDPNMLKLFVRFLREELCIDTSKILVSILCHTKDPEEVAAIEKYWLTQLELPPTSLRKTVFKQGGESRHTVLHYGMCSVRVHNTALLQHIFGAIQEYGGFDEPRWLF